MRTTWIKLLSLLALLTLFGTACTADDEGAQTEAGGDAGAATASDGATGDAGADVAQGGGGGGLLGEVQSRGTLRCGVNDTVPGFGFTAEGGEFTGFDIEFCRVIASAVLGDPEAVEFIALTAQQRFTAIQSGEIDVLSRNTTWTSTRDGSEGAAFAPVVFYDGQGMMVMADSEFQELADMQNTVICVQQGTTTELNLATVFNAQGIPYEPNVSEDNNIVIENFATGACDGFTSDKSQLAGIRSSWPEDQGGPEALRILDATMSKEPLAPAVVDGDSDWKDAVTWAVLATIQAEEFGITSANIEEFLESEDPEIRRFLGLPGGEDNAVPDFGLSLDPEFAQNVVRDVGNYGEIYERNVGPDTPLGLERGLNALWTEGGLLYSPPFR